MVSLLPTPHPKERRIIFGNISKPGYSPDIETYLAHGGYESLKKALGMKPNEIIDMVKAANLRGRGGAGDAGDGRPAGRDAGGGGGTG